MAIVLVFGFVFSPLSLAGPYEDCILQNMKGISDRLAANSVRLACKEKTTPKKCRGDVFAAREVTLIEKLTGKERIFTVRELRAYMEPPAEDFVAEQSRACLKECEAASWWARKNGECAID